MLSRPTRRSPSTSRCRRRRPKTQTVRVIEKAPTRRRRQHPGADPGHERAGAQHAGAGRTYDAGADPGAGRRRPTPVGTSFNGATGPENNFLIDGVNTTNPAFGLVGTQLTLEFIEETEIITGGYNAEYGRATGGVVNVVTKCGTNEFHGGVWFFYTPFQLDAAPRRRAPARPSRRRTQADDVRARLRLRPRRPDRQGPAVVLRRLRAAPSPRRDDRILRTRTPTTSRRHGRRTTTATSTLDVSCPPWLDKRSARDARASPRRDLLDASTRKRYADRPPPLQLDRQARLPLNDNNSLVVTVHRQPADASTASSAAHAQRLPDNGQLPRRRRVDQHARRAAALRVQAARSQAAARRASPATTTRTRSDDARPQLGGRPGRARSTPRPRRSTPFEPARPRRARRRRSTGVTSTPARSRTTVDGGFGFLDAHRPAQRIIAAASAHLLRAPRRHARHQARLRLRGQPATPTTRYYTGGAFYRVAPPAASRSTASSAASLGDGAQRPRACSCWPTRALGATTSTHELQRLPARLVQRRLRPRPHLNAGVRWEAQQVKDVNGNTRSASTTTGRRASAPSTTSRARAARSSSPATAASTSRSRSTSTIASSPARAS